MKYLIFYIGSLVLGGAGAWLVARWGSGFGLLDKANDRSSHEGVVPKAGGIGILAAFVLSSLVLKIPASFWFPATFLSLFSLLGDKVALSPKVRLPVQFIAALILLVSPPSPCSSIVWILFPAVFIVGTANFYNFMDGINGIAGITGVVGFGLLGWFAAAQGADPRIITLCVCLCLACIGFLPFNMPKARVFMGDVGSILLGFVFAGMVVWLSRSLLDFICLSAFLFPFYADELTTMIVRIKDRDRLTKPHRRHLYQLLANERGLSHWKISTGYGIVQLVVGMSVLIAKPFCSTMILLVLAVYFGGFVVLSFAIRRKLTTSA